jgi:hypothetical protein
MSRKDGGSPTLVRVDKIGIDKWASRQQSLRNGRFDEFRNNLVPARNADPGHWCAIAHQ